MTTDTRIKEAALRIEVAGRPVSIGGIAKGAGTNADRVVSQFLRALLHRLEVGPVASIASDEVVGVVPGGSANVFARSLEQRAGEPEPEGEIGDPPDSMTPEQAEEAVC